MGRADQRPVRTGRLKYAAHWKKQRDELQQVIKDNGVDVLGPTDLKHF